MATINRDTGYKTSRPLWLLLLLALLFANPTRAVEESSALFQVRQVNPAWVHDVYQINAQIRYTLTPQVEEALQKGVTLVVVVDIEIDRQRPYFLNAKVASLEQRYELRYHALSGLYLLTNANSGVLNSFTTLTTALEVLGRVVDLPVLDHQLIDPKEHYTGAMRARLDIDALPTPLRLLAYVTPGWRLSSEWFVWKLGK
ncbi:MAG: hypothetical protein FD130_2401 [Halothiobacillaceae bacterium]|nr:MAG: hypothetical protein FD130_2401 [Halothiobacillaceae bacterium]